MHTLEESSGGFTVGEFLLSKKFHGARVRHVDDGATGRVIGVRGETLKVKWSDGETDHHILRHLIPAPGVVRFRN